MTSPRLLLHLEGGALLAAAAAGYWQSGGPWSLFLVLFFAPDLSFLGFAAGPRVGAVCYNAAHFLVPPLALAVWGMLAASPLSIEIGLIWLAHIGLDRMLGYGLKYPTAFKDTHFQRV